jgi:hypothetical protein
MQSTLIKQHPFCGRPFMNPAFCGLSAHIGLFELPRTSVSGHHGRTEEVLDIGATLAGSSDENIGLMSGMSARPLTALGHVSLGKATPLHFQKAFTFFFGKKTVSQVGVSTPRASAFRVGLGVGGATIVSGSCACPSHLWISRVLTSSSSLGISSLFCRGTQWM